MMSRLEQQLTEGGRGRQKSLPTISAGEWAAVSGQRVLCPTLPPRPCRLHICTVRPLTMANSKYLYQLQEM